MRITCFSAFLLLQGSQAFAPQQRTVGYGKPTSSSLSEHREDGGWFGPATAAAVAGWALASQMAFASPLPIETQQPGASIQSTRDTPSLLLAGFGNVETMDFSMPSYGDATKGDVLGPGKAIPSIPSFNPFGSSETQEEETPSASPAVDAKADAKAAAEAKKAEEKSAAEAKKAEEEAKKAEKEARKLAQLEKQKEAAERSKQQAAVEEATSTPEISVPSFSAPEVSIPSFSAPSFSAPDMPEVKMPDIKMPDMPKMPSFSMPKIDLPDKPDMPKFDSKIPEFSAPKMPEFSAPKMSIPSFDAPKSSGGYDFGSPGAPAASGEDDVEPQEVRDSRAKDARSDFLVADNEAKELERQARDLRNIANGKKKVAKELKDDACKTRLGGKFVCLRPLNSGY